MFKKISAHMEWVGYVLGVLLVSLPQLRYIFSSEFNGLLPYRGADESIYLIRLQDALLSPKWDITAGIWGPPFETTGMQMAFLERIAGWMFGWAGLDATWIGFILSVLLAPLFIPLMTALFKRVGMDRLKGTLFALLLFILLGYFKRYVNQSWTLPILLTSLLLAWRYWESLRTRDAVCAGILFGLMTGVYLWAWTFSWAVLGVLFVLALDSRGLPDFTQRMKGMLIMSGITILIALPFIWQMYQVSHLPLYPEASIRMGFMYAREFESLPRSILIAMFSLSILFLFVRNKEKRTRYAPLISISLAPLIVMHQQFLHGRIIAFSAHYYPYVCVSAAIAFAYAAMHFQKRVPHLLIITSFLILIGAATYDYRPVLFPFQRVIPYHTRMAPLQPALEELKNDGKIETILTDESTSNLVASTTPDYVSYTIYSKIILVSTVERAERYCLSEVLSTEPINTDYLAEFDYEPSRAGRMQTDWLYERHVDITEDACARVSADIPAYLKKYHIDAVLWNKDEMPSWNTDRPFLQKRSEGEGWVLYDVQL